MHRITWAKFSIRSRLRLTGGKIAFLQQTEIKDITLTNWQIQNLLRVQNTSLQYLHTNWLDNGLNVK